MNQGVAGRSRPRERSSGVRSGEMGEIRMKDTSIALTSLGPPEQWTMVSCVRILDPYQGRLKDLRNLLFACGGGGFDEALGEGRGFVGSIMSACLVGWIDQNHQPRHPKSLPPHTPRVTSCDIVWPNKSADDATRTQSQSVHPFALINHQKGSNAFADICLMA